MVHLCTRAIHQPVVDGRRRLSCLSDQSPMMEVARNLPQAAANGDPPILWPIHIIPLSQSMHFGNAPGARWGCRTTMVALSGTTQLGRGPDGDHQHRGAPSRSKAWLRNDMARRRRVCRGSPMSSDQRCGVPRCLREVERSQMCPSPKIYEPKTPMTQHPALLGVLP